MSMEAGQAATMTGSSGSGGGDEAELCELLSAALERSGVLADVRARLRAGLYLALERPAVPPPLEAPGPLEGPAPAPLLALQLVHELLESLRLPHSAAVYRAETGRAYPPRTALARRLHLDEREPHLPLLVQLVAGLAHTHTPDAYDTTFTSDSSAASANTAPGDDADLPANVSQHSDKSQLYESSILEEIISGNMSDLNLNRNKSAASISSEIINRAGSKDSASKSSNSKTNINTSPKDNNQSDDSYRSTPDDSKKTEVRSIDDKSAFQYSNRTESFDESISEEIISQNGNSNKSNSNS